VWVDVPEEIDLDDKGDDGQVCAPCCMKPHFLSAIFFIFIVAVIVSAPTRVGM
jgi:hypothetical protein